MKKFVSIFLATCLVLMTPSIAFASEAGVMGGDIGYEWKERSRSSTTTHRGYGWSLCDPGSPATEAGETSTVTGAVSISASVGGTFKVPRNAILESLDVTLGVTFELSKSQTSRPLQKGEYVMGYVRPTWQQWTIYQDYYCYDTTVVGYDENGNAILETETSIVDTATAYVYKPILPQIKLEYHMSGISENSIRTMNTQEPHRVEIYGWKDGEYQLLEVWNEK